MRVDKKAAIGKQSKRGGVRKAALAVAGLVLAGCSVQVQVGAAESATAAKKRRIPVVDSRKRTSYTTCPAKTLRRLRYKRQARDLSAP